MGALGTLGNVQHRKESPGECPLNISKGDIAFVLSVSEHLCKCSFSKCPSIVIIVVTCRATLHIFYSLAVLNLCIFKFSMDGINTKGLELNLNGQKAYAVQH